MDDATLEKYIKAGKIAKEIREEAVRMAKPGVALLDIAEKIELLTREKGAEPAFPVNLSLNECAAHYTPQSSDETVISKGDVLKIDVGAHVDGFLADNAATVQFGENSKLVEASRSAVDAAIDLVKPGAKISDISDKIEETIRSFGFVPVRNLTGHGVDRYVVHTSPSMPNVSHASPKTLGEDQVIAIEPFATDGAGQVNDAHESFIFSFESAKPVRNPNAKKIMAYVQKFNGLPFAERWLLSGDAAENGIPGSLFNVRLALRELIQRGVLHSYPPLKEKKGSLVSQSEHTMIVRDPALVITR